MRLEDAIARLDAIHVQVLRSETFRGVRAMPTALTAGVALAACILQSSCFVPADPAEFTSYWLTVAALAAAIGLLDLAVYVVRGGAIAFRRAVVVLRQVLPAFGAAAVLTVVLLQTGDVATTLLPGLWSLSFALALAAAQPFLPPALAVATGFYFVAGVLLLVPDLRTPLVQPFGMGLTFGIGQLLTALALRRSAEELAHGS